MTDLGRAIKTLEAAVGDPSRGLPEEIFLLLTRLTPMINVDLLIRDAQGRLLLTWRSDACDGSGWHLPGGIIRFRETAAERIRLTARRELGAEVTFDPVPLTIREIIQPERRLRGHFISLLHNCTLRTPPDLARQFTAEPAVAGQWSWHEKFPDNVIACHREYAAYGP